jgi:hypothetical protein
LRKFQDLALEGRINAHESSLGRRHIPGTEKVQARFGVAFFGGKLLLRAIRRHSRVLIRREDQSRGAAIDPRRERLPKVVRETQAEAVAFAVCQAVGLESNNASADYIALYNGDKKTLTESLSVIQETSARILDELLPEERRTPSTQDSERLKQAPPEPPAQTPEPISFDR